LNHQILPTTFQWTGLRENLQETIFPLNMGLSGFNFPLNQSIEPCSQGWGRPRRTARARCTWPPPVATRRPCGFCWSWAATSMEATAAAPHRGVDEKPGGKTWG